MAAHHAPLLAHDVRWTGKMGASALTQRGDIRVVLRKKRTEAVRPGDELRVFLSYRRSDSAPYAKNVYDDLRQRFGRENVFWDVDSIALGRDFVDVVGEWLDRADVLLVIIGPSWLDTADTEGRRRLDDPDDHVRLEVEAALQRPELRVIPVFVGGATMPSSGDLPEPLAPLTRRNAASLITDHWAATMRELIEKLERFSDEPPATAGSSRTTSHTIRRVVSDTRAEPRTPTADFAPAPHDESPTTVSRAQSPSIEGRVARRRRPRTRTLVVLGTVVAIVAGASAFAAVQVLTESTLPTSCFDSWFHNVLPSENLRDGQQILVWVDDLPCNPKASVKECAQTQDDHAKSKRLTHCTPATPFPKLTNHNAKLEYSVKRNVDGFDCADRSNLCSLLFTVGDKPPHGDSAPYQLVFLAAS